MLLSSGHPDRNRVSEGRRDTNPYLKNGYQCYLKNRYQCGSGEAPPWKGYRRVRQVQLAVPPKQGENILRVPRTMYGGHEGLPQGTEDIRGHQWRVQRHPSPPTYQDHHIII